MLYQIRSRYRFFIHQWAIYVHEHWVRPGVDVMIAIFCDFRQFSAKKIGVFLKNQCYDQNFAGFTFVLSQKTPIFSLNLSAKIF
jgi:hypothetical protein